MDLVYLDTSAYLGFILGEKAAQQLLTVINQRPLCSSILLLIESERNLVRLSRSGLLTESDYTVAMQRLKQDREFFLLKETTADLCLTGEFPPIHTPRSNDLIHLRTARWFQRHETLSAFLTLDQQQKRAAQDLGLPVGEL